MEYGSMARRLHLTKMRIKDSATTSILLNGGSEDEEEIEVVEVMPRRQDDVESDENDYVVTMNMFGDDEIVIHDDDSQDSLDIVSDDDMNIESNIDSHIDGYLHEYLEQNKGKLKALAPTLRGDHQFHVFFVYHQNDRDWVLNVMEKLEMPAFGFKCCCHERDFDAQTSLKQTVHYGIKHSLKTVIVLSPDFVTETWCDSDSESQLLTDMDIALIQKDVITVMLQECDMPNSLMDVAWIDAAVEDWWGKLVSQLCASDDTPMTDVTNLSGSSSLVGLNPGLQSGQLLLSLKSRCGCCGKETVDPDDVPDDLIHQGIQIPPSEYHDAISHLMQEHKFRCHVWCYNTPAAIAFFCVFLCFCLTVIPLVEVHFVFKGRSETGLEFVHGGVVWLCGLTVYMLIIHISKRKMKENAYKRLTFVNTILVKYNLLSGLENLGLADCNKYLLHYFYYEIGPCLVHLQELMVNIEEYNVSHCYHNNVSRNTTIIGLDSCMDEEVTVTNDLAEVLDNRIITNASMQSQAEDILLENSGEYISSLITKKLERPRKQRHVRDAPCLCQYVEHRVYKMIV
ncbi:hypothetical protein CAPTEDRAFT_224550 [Capitella teleta]|uniref:TIR domain-containing protein n=1 Tax=Capitella teleta TaxID=283909 RepID=R7V9X1_CAPTE|nr:hypothetical protein CAPTEDRAFT_224550 [Capitella teleta]|eukprot:ELU15394.1 hypothetical protein CAPTEDRAFT_224550 [Capitella teleta]